MLSSASESRNRQVEELILQHRAPEDFLRAAVPVFKAHNRNFSFAQVARLAGFSSRSYVRGLFQGQRLLTEAPIPKLSAALKLKKELEHLLLWRVQSRSANSPEWQKKAQVAASALEAKIRDRSSRKACEGGRQKELMFKVEDWVYLFASLGKRDVGASLTEVSRRSKRPEGKCRIILREMIAAEIVSFDPVTECYIPRAAFLNFESLGLSDSYRKFFEASLRQVSRMVPSQFNDPHALFFTSVFSIRRSQLPELTKALQSALVEFSEGHEDPLGDEVVLLQTAVVGAH